MADQRREVRRERIRSTIAPMRDIGAPQTALHDIVVSKSYQRVLPVE